MRVLIIGEECKDVFVYGEVKRLCPEAPVPVFQPSYKTVNRGMAGNVAENILALNKEASINMWTQSSPIVKTRYVEEKSNHMIMRLDEGDNILKTNYLLLSEIENYDVVIVSDYNKGFLSDSDILTIGRECQFLGKISIIDSKRKLNNEIVESYTFVKLNKQEFSKAVETVSSTKNIIVTMGASGAKMNNVVYPSPNPLQTIDVSGAGDTFVAAFSIKYYETKDVTLAINYANDMAAKVVAKRGVATP